MKNITLYTDAGCAQGKGGFAFLFRFYGNQPKQILGYGNTATEDALYIELLAIKRALEFIYYQNLSEYEIELCCDVLSIVHFFNDSAYKKYLVDDGKKCFRKFMTSNLDLLQDIIFLIESTDKGNIRFVKVKSKKN